MKLGIPGIKTSDLAANIQGSPNGPAILGLIDDIQQGKPVANAGPAVGTLIEGLKNPITRGVVLGVVFDRANRSPKTLGMLQEMLGDRADAHLNRETRQKLIEIAQITEPQRRVEALKDLVRQRVSEVGSDALLSGSKGPPNQIGNSQAAVGSGDPPPNPNDRFRALLDRMKAPNERDDAVRELATSLKDPDQRANATQALIDIGKPAARALLLLSSDAEMADLINPVVASILSGEQPAGAGGQTAFGSGVSTRNVSDVAGKAAVKLQQAAPSVGAYVDARIAEIANPATSMDTLSAMVKAGGDAAPLFCEILMRTR